MLCIQVSAMFVSFSEYTGLQFQNSYSEVNAVKMYLKKKKILPFLISGPSSTQTVVWDVTM